MGTVLSHIVQKRYSQENENIATDALAYILQSSDSARAGMMRLLRGIVPEMPDLEFRTQLSDDSIRPDMEGHDGCERRVYVENKFWAGLTDNQPCEYLRSLAGCAAPTILLMVVPEAREQAVWREALRRLEVEGIGTASLAATDGLVHAVATEAGPVFALTSWARVLATLELAAADDAGALSDIAQLRALCDAADSEAFIPISATEVTDQRIPALILQVGGLMQAAVEVGVTEEIVIVDGLRTVASWDRIGRYVRFPGEAGPGFWIGVHLSLWRKHGGTPLWLLFPSGAWGRPTEVRTLLEPWAERNGVCAEWRGGDYVVAVDIETGEERDQVVRGIVDQLKTVGNVLASATPETGAPDAT